MIRFYHVVAINNRSGQKVYLTDFPVPHAEACIILSKLPKHAARRVQLEEVQ